MLSANFIALFIACLEDMDPISLMFVLSEMFIILKGFDMVSSLAVTLQYSLLFGILACLGVTDIYLLLKSYLLTSDISYAVRTLDDRSSDPSSVNLVYM